jgi:glycosyltransferase involved in cell wall biosynthesis
MPLALLEAMQWQVPIIATAVGGIPHVLAQGAHGTLVPARDVDSLSRALNELSADRAGALQRVAAATLEVDRKYSSARMAREYAALYGELQTSGAA